MRHPSTPPSSAIDQFNESTSPSFHHPSFRPSKHQTTVSPIPPSLIPLYANLPYLQTTNMHGFLSVATLGLATILSLSAIIVPVATGPIGTNSDMSENPAQVLDARYSVQPACFTACVNNAGCSKGGKGCHCILRKQTYNFMGRPNYRIGFCGK